jgi:H+-translocating NAD(P) transhydrogenase subunit alpha
MEIATLTFFIIIFVLACAVGYFVVWGVTPALHTPLMAVTNAISGIVVVAAILVMGFDASLPPPLCAASSLAPECLAGASGAIASAGPTGGAIHILQTTSFVLAFVATVLCSINIFGGFAITRRMLAMFRKKGAR